jgi:FAD/FMN-containing dehydrogenase
MESEQSAGRREEYYPGPIIRDWAHIVAFQPKLYLRPQSLEELKRFLQAMHSGVLNFKSLRVLGGLHSCSDICAGEVIIDPEDLPKTIEFSPDLSEVTVSANWHFHEFLQALGEKGKTITATGGTDRQTLAGIISTNTAPATPYHTIYEQVNWIEYLSVDPVSGEVFERQVARTDPDFSALVCSLGAVGILTRVQFALVDQIYFETVQKVVKLKEMLGDIEKTSREYDFWRIDWIPDSDEGVIWTARQVDFAPPDGDYPFDQAQGVLEAVYNILDKFETAGPLLDNPMRLLYKVLALTYGEIVARGPLRNMLPVDRYSPLHVAMAEWSFNPADLELILERCKTYFETNGWPNLPIEIELTKTDSYYMSAWNWPGLDYILKLNFMYLTEIITTEQERELMVAHLKGLWTYLQQAGIPLKAHWGKLNFMDPDFVREHFQFDKFEPFIRPMFLNAYLKERLPAAVPTPEDASFKGDGR